MKRIFLIFCVLTMVLVSGCAEKTPPEPILDFSARITVDKAAFSEEFSVEADITSTMQGAVSIRITTPDEIAPLCYKWGESFDISLYEYTCRTNAGYLPPTSFAEGIYSALYYLTRNGECVSFRDGEAVFEGVCRSGRYRVTTDGDGVIKTIVVDEINLCVQFEYSK